MIPYTVMRPYFGPFVDGPDRPPPEIVELRNVAHPTFALKLRDDFSIEWRSTTKADDFDVGFSGDKFLTTRAKEAYLWLKENALGLYRPDPDQKTIGNYVNLQILDERDVVLFKTYWL